MKMHEFVGDDSGVENSSEESTVSMQSDVGSRITVQSDLITSLEPDCGVLGEELCISMKALSMQDAMLIGKKPDTLDIEKLNSTHDNHQGDQLTADLKLMSLDDDRKTSITSLEPAKVEADVEKNQPSTVDHKHNGPGLPQEHEDTSTDVSQNGTNYVPRGPHGGIPATPTAAVPYPWPAELYRQVYCGDDYHEDQPAKFVRPNVSNGYDAGKFVVDGSVALTTDQCGPFNFGSIYECQVSQTAHAGVLSGGCVRVQPLQPQPLASTYTATPFSGSSSSNDLFSQKQDFVDDIIRECLHNSPDNLDVYFPSGDLPSLGVDDLPGSVPIQTPVPTESSSDMGYSSPPYTNPLSPFSVADTDSSLGYGGFVDDSLPCDEQLLEIINEIIENDAKGKQSATSIGPGAYFPNSDLIQTSPPSSAVTCCYSESLIAQPPLQYPQLPVTRVMPHLGTTTQMSLVQMPVTAASTNVHNSVSCPYVISTTLPSTHPPATTPMVMPCSQASRTKLREIRPKPQPESDLVSSASGNMTTNIIAGVNVAGFHVPQPLPCDIDLINTSEDRQRHVRFCRELAEYKKPQLLYQDPEGDTLLHLAVARKEQTFIAALLPRMERELLIPVLINKVNENNWTPLHMAVLTNQVAVARELIKYGAHANVQIHCRREGNNYIFLKPIHYAASKGYQWTNMLEVLLTAPDVDVHAFDSEGRTPLHRAIDEHNGEQVDSRRSIYLLAQAGADLAKQDQRVGETALHYAVRKKNAEFVAWILGLVCEMVKKTTPPEQLEHRQRQALSNIINMRSNAGVTALQMAFNLRTEQLMPDQRIRIIELLLRNGATFSTRTDTSLKKELSNIPELKELLKILSRNGHS